MTTEIYLEYCLIIYLCHRFSSSTRQAWEKVDGPFDPLVDPPQTSLFDQPDSLGLKIESIEPHKTMEDVIENGKFKICHYLGKSIARLILNITDLSTKRCNTLKKNFRQNSIHTFWG